MDGVITTVSFMTGAYGLNVSKQVVSLLALLSVLGDGFSLGVSSFLGKGAEIAPDLSPFVTGLITYGSFILFGMMPVIPLWLPLDWVMVKWISVFVAICMFFVIGYIKGSKRNTIVKSITETILYGIAAMCVTYGLGRVIHK